MSKQNDQLYFLTVGQTSKHTVLVKEKFGNQTWYRKLSCISSISSSRSLSSFFMSSFSSISSSQSVSAASNLECSSSTVRFVAALSGRPSNSSSSSFTLRLRLFFSSCRSSASFCSSFSFCCSFSTCCHPKTFPL